MVVFRYPDMQPRDLGHQTWNHGVRRFGRFHLLGLRTRRYLMPHPCALGMFGNIWMTPDARLPWMTRGNMRTTMHPWGG
jgi:hypothetical protein